jgi:fatty aldehyde-generating acyl-ACP reductase
MAPWFAFIVHLRGVDDLARFRPTAFLRRLSSSESEYRDRISKLPPLVIATMRFGGTALEGELIAVARMPEDLAGRQGSVDVARAVALAASRGVAVVGLGGLTSPCTGGGRLLLRELSPGITITNGNAYTAAVVLRNVSEATAYLGQSVARTTVAIVGCTGSVGVAASRLIAQAGHPLVLIGRSAQRVSSLLPDLVARFGAAARLEDARSADVVVLLTSDPTARLDISHVKSSAVVIDCAQPANLSAEAHTELNRSCTRAVTGGMVRIPNYDSTLDLGFSDERDAPACLAETYLFARAGIRTHSVGRATADLARRLEVTAERFGIRPSRLTLSAHT